MELSLNEQKRLALAVQKIKEDPVEYINKVLYTFNPRIEPYHLPFRLFSYQIELVKQLREAIDNGHDIFVEKSRDVGATYTTLGVFLWYWVNVPGSNFLVGSRKQDLVDNTGGSNVAVNKEESLFGKMEYMLRRSGDFALPRGFDISKHMTFMSLVNPENGNVISGESSNPNFSRGGRFKAVLLDEFAFWENDISAWGATADTTNCRIVITTPGIKPGKAKRLRFGKDGEQIKIVEIDYKQDPRKDDRWEDRERTRRSAEDFAREVLRNWEVSIEGRVYEEIKHAEVGDFPYQPDWPLFVSWDFGLDGTAIQVWQKNMVNGKPRLIDSFFKSNEPIHYFLPLFGHSIDSTFTYGDEELNAISDFSVYKKGIHYGDPDVNKRAYQDKASVSTRQVLSNAGIYIQTRPESNDFFTRREQTKVLLQRRIEVNNTPRNDYWLESIKMARYPKRDENSQAVTPINLPIHDWTSHHRTALEYFAVNFREEENLLSNETNYPPDQWEDKQWRIGR